MITLIPLEVSVHKCMLYAAHGNYVFVYQSDIRRSTDNIIAVLRLMKVNLSG